MFNCYQNLTEKEKLYNITVISDIIWDHPTSDFKCRIFHCYLANNNNSRNILLDRIITTQFCIFESLRSSSFLCGKVISCRKNDKMEWRGREKIFRREKWSFSLSLSPNLGLRFRRIAIRKRAERV